MDLRKLYRPVISEPWTVHGMGKALHDISTNCPSVIVVKLRGSTNVKYVGPWSCAVGTKVHYIQSQPNQLDRDWSK